MVQALVYQTWASLILGSSQICRCLGMCVIAHLAVSLDGPPEASSTVLYTLLLHPSEHKMFG